MFHKNNHFYNNYQGKYQINEKLRFNVRLFRHLPDNINQLHKQNKKKDRMKTFYRDLCKLNVARDIFARERERISFFTR